MSWNNRLYCRIVNYVSGLEYQVDRTESLGQYVRFALETLINSQHLSRQEVDPGNRESRRR